MDISLMTIICTAVAMKFAAQRHNPSNSQLQMLANKGICVNTHTHITEESTKKKRSRQLLSAQKCVLCYCAASNHVVERSMLKRVKSMWTIIRERNDVLVGNGLDEFFFFLSALQFALVLMDWNEKHKNEPNVMKIKKKNRIKIFCFILF